MPTPRKRRSKLNSDQQALRDEGYCAAKVKRGQGYCRKECGWGTDHVGHGPCKLHGGATANHTRAAQKEQAAEAVERYGLPVQTDPHSALVDELNRTAGHVAWLRQRINELPDDEDLYGPVGVEGVDQEKGTVHHPEAKRHIWLTLYQEERRHLADVAATCIKVGIEERRVRLAEQQGQMIATVLSNVLQALGIDPSSPKARKVVRAELTAASGPEHAMEGEATEVAASGR